ncbi:kinase-like domain-containing protein [Gilbertella persicaria]|uniref:kinase-like domain-containing protein n=1 Tax=Gilbertella persicaria TaxID=101096 RepID=UPI00221E3AA3|nr:kinase-like domain-containing protein [Gilbertella persicaria]KAI8087617.1 kinase-like domain-containing protein [Gilbertella persicaria]
MVNQDTYWSQLSASMVDKIVGEEFQLLEVLGHGAYGCLFLGQSLQDNSYVAVKVLSKSGLDLQQLQLQQLEIDIQMSLKHSSLLALHRVIQDTGYIYMVMELCDQGDLFDYVIRDQDVNPIREEHMVKKLFTQILDGVESMHAAGVYHRDLKLENILLRCEDDEDEDEFTCKVADFGLATRERYSMEFGCGSTSYLAPEHFDDDKQVELVPYDAAASDTWSLGILLLALMFGRNPWQEASSADPAFNEFKRNPIMLKQQLFPELSDATYRLLESVLTIDGSDRPSVAEMKEQFLAIDRIYDDQDEDYLDDKKESPVSIPTATTKHADMNSFDSAFFSGGNGSSWSDMVEEDEELARKSDFDHYVSPAMSHYDEDDTEMFVHSGEKESWWL